MGNKVTGILKATGVDVSVQKTQDQSIEQAIEPGFLSSPGARINGKDLQLDCKETYAPEGDHRRELKRAAITR